MSTATAGKVTCIKCDTEHDEHPAARDGENKDGVPVMGVWAEDYTYYKDNYFSRGYHVLCKHHNRDSISHKSDKEVASGY